MQGMKTQTARLCALFVIPVLAAGVAWAGVAKNGAPAKGGMHAGCPMTAVHRQMSCCAKHDAAPAKPGAVKKTVKQQTIKKSVKPSPRATGAPQHGPNCPMHAHK